MAPPFPNTSRTRATQAIFPARLKVVFQLNGAKKTRALRKDKKIKEVAERVGYSPSPFRHPTIFSVTSMNTASILAISTISSVSTASPISTIWAKFLAQADTKDTKPNTSHRNASPSHRLHGFRPSPCLALARIARYFSCSQRSTATGYRDSQLFLILARIGRAIFCATNKEQLAICFFGFSQQAAKLVKKARVLTGTAPGYTVRRLPHRKIGQFGRLLTVRALAILSSVSMAGTVWLFSTREI